jgi:hypothetical protein
VKDYCYVCQEWTEQELRLAPTTRGGLRPVYVCRVCEDKRRREEIQNLQVDSSNDD